MAEFLYDPSTGQRSTSVPAPGERFAPAATQRDPLADWRPNDSPIDGHDEPYEVGDGAPSTGPAAGNVIITPPGPFSKSKQG